MISGDKLMLKFCNYETQAKELPSSGKHIIAYYDNDFIVVYQAYKPSIAKYAVENQHFGGPEYSFNRMSWIKTSFLWMMYRSGWASKCNQERILAIYVSHSGFKEIVENAYTVQREKEENLTKAEICVRLQWDPDHDPHGFPIQRRAIQLGLKNKMLQRFNDNFILKIEDITSIVKEQEKNLTDIHMLSVPLEKVYVL